MTSTVEGDASREGKLGHQNLHALRAEAHGQIRDAWIKEPPSGFTKLRLSIRDEESLHFDAMDRLEGGGYDLSMENIERLKPLLVRARPGPFQNFAKPGLFEVTVISLGCLTQVRTPPRLFIS
jgi:hypothetical protein